MKMQLLEFENDIYFKEDVINVLEIQNIIVFRNVVRDLFRESNGEIQNSIRFIENGEEQNYNNKLFCILDYYNFDYNIIKNVNSLYKYLFKDQTIIQNSSYINMMKCYQELLNQVDIDLCYDELNFINLSKALKLKFDIKADKLFEKILAVIDIESELNINKLVVLINIKDYLSTDELRELYKYILYKKVNILLIESKHTELKIENEIKIEIDSEFDEFVI